MVFDLQGSRETYDWFLTCIGKMVNLQEVSHMGLLSTKVSVPPGLTTRAASAMKSLVAL